MERAWLDTFSLSPQFHFVTSDGFPVTKRHWFKYGPKCGFLNWEHCFGLPKRRVHFHILSNIQALWHTKIECVLTQKETVVSGWKIRIKCNSQKMPYQGILWNKIVGTVSLLPPLIHLKDTYNLMLFSSQQHQHIYFGSTRIQFPLSGRAYIGTYENVSSSLEKFITRTSLKIGLTTHCDCVSSGSTKM